MLFTIFGIPLFANLYYTKNVGKSIHNFHNFSFLFSEWIGKVYKLPKNSRFTMQKSSIFQYKIHVYNFHHLCYYVLGEDWRLRYGVYPYRRNYFLPELDNLSK